MEIFFDIDFVEEELRSVLFFSSEGHFYGETISTGKPIKHLKYQDYMFHLESDPEHKNIEIKESTDNVISGLLGWLNDYEDKTFITYENNELKLDLIKNRVGLDLSGCVIEELNIDKNLSISERVSELRREYENNNN